MNFTLFNLIWATIAAPLDAGTAQVIQALAEWVNGRFQICVVAYFIVTLLIASWSTDEDAYLRFFRQIFLASVIFTMASNAGTYNYYVTGIAHGLVGSISQAVGNFFGNSQQVGANGFDTLASQTFALGLAVYKQLPEYSLKAIGLIVLIGLYWAASMLAVSLMFVVYMAAYLVTDILLGIGPLFVALYFFPFTRNLFHGWLRNLLTGILAQVFAVLVAAFFFATMTAILAQGGRDVAAAGDVTTTVGVGILLTLAATMGIELLFGFIAIYVVYMAANIAGGLAPPLPRFARFSFGGADGPPPSAAAPLPHNPPPSSGALPPNNNAPSSVVAPVPDYAFNRTVGSAP